ncbi:hypothetical protein LLH06_15065 [Mucilaginibacter daejeonensis]|uniref:hypothetical protein n=1 Tax=Mucilaginibacter daejeonensis TaxID=398049 RepID=UPI001D170ECD|nr:hypothetical protein [Mucilaginibacter daejeonensis]UEG52284.1 hypothetical protein LLH06_15065 [Mucilaginibacter daejeonensis]
MRILITAAATAKAYQLKGQLNGHDVLLGDHTDLPEVMLKSGAMITTPKPQSDTYPHEMLALCLDHHIGEVYLLRPEEMAALAPAELLFSEYGIKLTAAYDQL